MVTTMATAAASRTERRQRREDVRAKLIEAIGELAEESAFRDLTVDAIARHAGLSRSAFYFYFRDKHDLLIAAAAEVADDLYVEADRWWHGQGEPGALVREALTGVAFVYARHGGLLGLAVEVSAYDPDVRAFWRSLVERFVDATAEHLEHERDGGRLAAVVPRPTAEALVWMAERCLWLFLARGERPVDEVVDQLASVWMAAIYADPAGA